MTEEAEGLALALAFLAEVEPQMPRELVAITNIDLRRIIIGESLHTLDIS